MRLLWHGNTCAATSSTATLGRAAACKLSQAPLATGGYGDLEDPYVDARSAHPHWLSASSVLRLTPNPTPAHATPFSLWTLPGRKSLLHDGETLLLTVGCPQPLQLALAAGVAEGTPLDILLPVNGATRSLWPAITRLISLLEKPKRASPKHPPARPSREMLVHMRALQALDAEAAGATHREIATTLFGEDEVFQRWDTNSELRAQVRYLLRRGRALRDGGYQRLLGAAAGEGEMRPRPDSP